jgi:hypothetical protein
MTTEACRTFNRSGEIGKVVAAPYPTPEGDLCTPRR